MRILEHTSKRTKANLVKINLAVVWRVDGREESLKKKFHLEEVYDAADLKVKMIMLILGSLDR